jgi:hypothetical protein
MPIARLLGGVWTLAVLAAGLLAPLVAPPSSDAATRYEARSVAPWKKNASPAGWNPASGEIVYNRRGSDGLWDAYRAAPDGGGETCITCSTPSFASVGAATHRGASDVSPDGRHLLLDVERGSHFGTIGASEAEPGRGAYSDVWLSTSDGSRAWPLTDIYDPANVAIGTIWPRFDRTGTRVVWAEMYAPSILNLGFWSLKVADIVWTDGTPRLEHVKTYRPEAGRFYEPYGFSPDNRRIVFASDMGMPSWWDSQIYSVSTDFTDLKRLSPPDVAPGFFANYNEFAFYAPAGDRIVYGRTVGALGGIDYWVMNPDGSGQRRLTFMNEPWHTQTRGFTVAGGMAFDPHNPNRFVAGVASDSFANSIDSVMVSLDGSDEGNGLRAEYFSDSSLRQPALTRVENPAAGFKWTGSPGPGVPADRFSVRWSGTVTPPEAGRYTYCVYADDGVRLWVGGQLVIDAWDGWPGRRCGTVSHASARPAAIRMEYWDKAGDGAAQLTWSGPGVSAQSVADGQQPIPADRLRAAAAPQPAAPAPAPATQPAPAQPTATAVAPAKRAAARKSRAARPAKCPARAGGKHRRSARRIGCARKPRPSRARKAPRPRKHHTGRSR